MPSMMIMLTITSRYMQEVLEVEVVEVEVEVSEVVEVVEVVEVEEVRLDMRTKAVPSTM